MAQPGRQFFTPGGIELRPEKPRIRLIDPDACIALTAGAIGRCELHQAGLIWRCDTRQQVGFGCTPAQAWVRWKQAHESYVHLGR